MKALTINIFLGVLVFSSFTNSNAQVYNWSKIESGNHIVRAHLGLDFGVIYGLHYGRRLTIKNATLVPFIDLSLPLGGEAIDDSKLKIGTSAKVLQRKKWFLTADVSFISRQNTNPFVAMHNIGFESGVQFGYYKKRWFLNANISNDYSFATHLKHTEAYKGNYAGAVDGWYKNTANNFSIGLNTGYSFKKIDITLSPGIIRTDGWSSTPTLPFYGKIGVNYRL